MKKILVSITLLLFLMLFTISPRPLYAGYKEGVAAYERGDYKTAFRELKASAEKGVTEAQHSLGFMYLNGQGVTRDYKEARKWFRKAAEQGDAETQFYLGMMYEFGKGVTQNYKEAFKWYKKAAEQGYAKAQYNLGGMYYRGQGVTRDYKKAVRWLRKAAEQGDASAQYNLGGMYYNGLDVPNEKGQRSARVSRPRRERTGRLPIATALATWETCGRRFRRGRETRAERWAPLPPPPAWAYTGCCVGLH